MEPWELKALFVLIVVAIFGCLIILMTIAGAKLSRRITPHDELEPLDPELAAQLDELDDWLGEDEPEWHW